MTTKGSTQNAVPDPGNIHGFKYQWTLASGDDGNAVTVDYVGSADRSVQVEGTFGAGGGLVFEGSNDGTNYHTLTDPVGVALSFTAAGLKEITEACLYMRPRVTGGDGTTALTVTALLRRTFR